MKKNLTIFATILFLILSDIIISKYFTIYNLKPNLWLIYILFVSLFLGHTDAVLLGFFCGMILDILHMTIFGVNTFVLTTIGYLFGWLFKRINESLLKVQLLTLFLGSILYLGLIFIVSKLFSISISFSYITFFITFLDLFIGFIFIRIFIWYYETLGII
ncbi:MAG: rod shape-determining protein MreD [Endomicrobiia bacterium]